MSWTTPAAFGFVVFAIGASAILTDTNLRLPGDHSGYEPAQPVAFSHRLHAGELGMDCLACHSGAEKSRHAGIPTSDVCMGCHQHVTAGFDAVLMERQAAAAEGRDENRIVSPRLRALFDLVGVDADLSNLATVDPAPIPWVRVHHIPDHAYFDHRVHVARGLACQQCHGPVQSMERMRQEETLSMGWCIDCHRSSPATETPGAEEVTDADHVSIDCVRCHY